MVNLSAPEELFEKAHQQTVLYLNLTLNYVYHSVDEVLLSIRGGVVEPCFL